MFIGHRQDGYLEVGRICYPFDSRALPVRISITVTNDTVSYNPDYQSEIRFG